MQEHPAPLEKGGIQAEQRGVHGPAEMNKGRKIGKICFEAVKIGLKDGLDKSLKDLLLLLSAMCCMHACNESFKGFC